MTACTGPSPRIRRRFVAWSRWLSRRLRTRRLIIPNGRARLTTQHRPIVEAARALYSQHSVEAIARSDAGAKNLHLTSRRLEDIVDESNASRPKAICFVTGVPGAGKTLVGLNIATRRREEDQPTHAVFLSGNGPLVAVLREALTRDEVARRKAAGEKVKKGRIGERVKAFIQNVHHFRDEALLDPKAPHEHVAIFDEAQRAWNQKQTASFMQRKKKRSGFNQSEPEFLISYMDRHQDWSVVICLVGGGQEIHRGEAGIDAWLDAVNSRFPHWDMHISSRLTDTEYAAGRVLDRVRHRPNTHLDDSLHLGVSMRSFRAENVSSFIKALLDCEKQHARESFAKISERYPIILTRNLDDARDWIRARARGTERYGLVASSKAQRLKPHAVDIRVDVDPVHYFLGDRTDTRSSYYLEDAATEFQVQGLELDWTCVTWDADLRFTGSGWSFHDFRGDRWCNIGNTDNRAYLRNAYRVLLTRARQGMVIFVPPGNATDPTRSAAFYDSTFGYLLELGIPQLS
jgi:Schlafen group 3, DNA/RNA helicase domain